MPGKAKLADVVEALESAGDEHYFYLDRRTGEIVVVMDEFADPADDDDIAGGPDWQRQQMLLAKRVREEEGHFWALPRKFEIHEWHIMEAFCNSLGEGRARDVLLEAIHCRRAFRHFKDAAVRLEILDQWHAFRNEALRQIAIDWLEDNGVEYEE